MTILLFNYMSRHKDGLAFQLFSYMVVIVISILVAQTLAEQALVKTMLKVPQSVKNEMLDLAQKANVLIEDGNMEALANWAQAQRFDLFVVDENAQPLTQRMMHPHFQFKLQFKRSIDEQLENRVSRPIISIPLKKGMDLVIQLPHQLHPAREFIFYSAILKLLIAVVILVLFSILIARNLQQPLSRLREASKKLSNGDFNVCVVDELHSKTREFNELAEDFDHMTREVHRLAEKQRRLIRDVSHELRTPLARQNLVLHLLRNKVGPKEQKLVGRLEDEATQLNDLIGEILEFSRLENTRYRTELVKSDLLSLLELQISRCEIELRPEQSITLTSEAEQTMVLCDKALVIRCVSNLVTNAIKYAGEQAIIEVSLANQTIEKERYLTVSVADSGAGIPEDRLDDIFSPFTRLEASRDKKAGGYGLGLAIVKESMRIMGGKVIAANRVSGGFIVTLCFPERTFKDL
ncbi:putative two-component histidine kinase [Vibrio azureus NBRC 104587]|uniref:histidine kinase n=2 Tax=Vibrio azureus TaxID=512649 RepID=U3ATY7_9VIBR|nr:putative two-component histidine kinase [Vibrio azureus NBRC 104587]